MEVPGVGPVLANAIVAAVPALGHSNPAGTWDRPGKERLGGITKQGDRYLRQLLVVGALRGYPLCQTTWHKATLASMDLASAQSLPRDDIARRADTVPWTSSILFGQRTERLSESRAQHQSAGTW